jgi:hypothetical protein
MTIQEFIEYYSRNYKNFDIFSDTRLYSNASYLMGFADGYKKNETLQSIATDVRSLAHMISELRRKA